MRDKAGVTGAEAFVDPKDGNAVTITIRFPSLEAAQGFFGDPGLKDAMMKSGVEGAHSITVVVAK